MIKRILSNRRGSSTLEYVIILTVAALLALFLYNAVSSDEIKGSIQKAIQNAINGNSVKIGSEETSESPDGNTSPPPPQKDTSKPKDPPGFLEKLKQKYNEYDEYIKCASTGSIGGYWACMNQDDIKKDLKDMVKDPKGYLKEVIGYEDLKDSWDKLTSVDYGKQWERFWDDPGTYMERKGKYLKEQWDKFSENPGGNLLGLGSEIIGWNDLKLWWTGIDPETGEKVRIPNRLWAALTGLPTPAKAGKVTKAADKDALDVVHDFVCAKKNADSCERDNTSNGKSDNEDQKPKLEPGTAEHKSARWKEYQENGGEWDYDRWSKIYGSNMKRANTAHEAMNDYWQRIGGWGKREVTVDVNGQDRRLDIVDVARRKGIEHKTTTKDNGVGYFYLSKDLKSELERDAYLVNNKKWEITWVFENATASKPLIEELKKNNIKIKIIDKGGT